jgi:ADP-ribose pyrophosphatase
MSEKTISSRTVFDGRAIKLRVDTVMTDDGRTTTREVVEHIDCVAVVAIDAVKNVLLVRQFRQSIGKELLEIPAGGIEPGETPEKAVEREMREETGFQPERVERLGGYYSSPGFCTEYLHLYLASDLVPNPLTAEDTQGIQLVSVTPDQITALIRSGTICDSKSVAGLLQYLHVYKKEK